MNISNTSILKFVPLFLTILVLLNIGGCATKPKPPFEIKSPEMSMIFGSIYIPGHEVTEIEIREYGKLYLPPFSVPPRVMIYQNGTFVAENLKPSNYYISRFVSKKLTYALVKDKRSAYQRIITVKAGTVNYVGAYVITDYRPGIFVEGEFNIKMVRHPTERQVLKHMYYVTEGTGWQSRIKRRIMSLR